MGRIHNPATGEEIEVDCADPEAMRRAMDRLVETPEPLEADKQSAEESRQAAQAGERERAAVARADAAEQRAGDQAQLAEARETERQDAIADLRGVRAELGPGRPRIGTWPSAVVPRIAVTHQVAVIEVAGIPPGRAGAIAPA